MNPRTITVDKNPGYPRAAAEMKRTGELWRSSFLRQCEYLNDIVEQDHRRIKRLVRPGLGFGSLRTARRTLAGYEAMAMIRKGQVHNVDVTTSARRPPLSAGSFRRRPESTHFYHCLSRPEFATEPKIFWSSAPIAAATAAVLYTILETARLNDLNPEAYLADVIDGWQKGTSQASWTNSCPAMDSGELSSAIRGSSFSESLGFN